MNDLAKIIVVSFLATGLAITVPGCGESSSPSASSRSADDWNDHGESGHEVHGHGPGGHDDHDHSTSRALGRVTVGGAILVVFISGDLEPGAKVHVELEHIEGPVPAAIRLWIGDKTGFGAIKSKADGHIDHFRTRTEVPADISGAALWIEVEAEDGTRSSASAPLD